jgi:hypothetical protein
MITTSRRPVIKQCPYKPETDFGELVITTAGPPSRLQALAEAIAAITARPVSHEDFTAAVAALLPAGARAASTWHTAGWEVEVTVEGRRMATALRRPVARQCPRSRETGLSELAITLAGPAPELHALAAAVAAITARPVSREDLAVAVAALLPSGAQVTATCHVPGWTVEVTDAAVPG